jgi:methionine synthase I (cobalamin-dependent)
MNYQHIKKRLDAKDIIVLDGGTGTELQRRGAQMDTAAWCGPASLTNSALLTEIHLDYIKAGADVITANTYASSRLMLTGAGFGDRVAEINTIAVEAALRARDLAPEGRKVVVAGSLSHMVPVAEGTAVVDPTKTPPLNQISDAFHELAQVLKTAGVDHIMLEMMYEPTRVPLVLEAALATGLPVWFGLSARRTTDGRVVAFHAFDDLPLEEITKFIPKTGVDIRKTFSGPLSAYPDGGYFEMPDWRFVDVIEPTRLETFFEEWTSLGAQVLGGCCGLTVEHVDAAQRVALANR